MPRPPRERPPGLAEQVKDVSRSTAQVRADSHGRSRRRGCQRPPVSIRRSGLPSDSCRWEELYVPPEADFLDRAALVTAEGWTRRWTASWTFGPGRSEVLCPVRDLACMPLADARPLGHLTADGLTLEQSRSPKPSNRDVSGKRTQPGQSLSQQDFPLSITATFPHVGQMSLERCHKHRRRRVIPVHTRRPTAAPAVPHPRDRRRRGEGRPCRVAISAPEGHHSVLHAVATIGVTHRARTHSAPTNTVTSSHALKPPMAAFSPLTDTAGPSRTHDTTCRRPEQ